MSLQKEEKGKEEKKVEVKDEKKDEKKDERDRLAFVIKAQGENNKVYENPCFISRSTPFGFVKQAWAKHHRVREDQFKLYDEKGHEVRTHDTIEGLGWLTSKPEKKYVVFACPTDPNLTAQPQAQEGQGDTQNPQESPVPSEKRQKSNASETASQSSSAKRPAVLPPAAAPAEKCQRVDPPAEDAKNEERPNPPAGNALAGGKLEFRFLQQNPKKKDSQAGQRYELYKVATNQAEFYRLGGRKADLLYDHSKGFLKYVTE